MSAAREDDLVVELQEPVVPEPTFRTRPDAVGCALAQAGEGPPCEPEVFLHVDAVTAVLEHAVSSGRVEVGGLLVGEFCRDDGGAFVLVTAAIPARTASGTATSLTFTQDAWGAMLDEREARYPGKRVVGWYHTHPGLRIFLSRPDQFIHTGFFTAPCDIAVVVDPRRLQWGVFRWRGDRLEAATRFFVYSDTVADAPRLAQVMAQLGERTDLVVND